MYVCSPVGFILIATQHKTSGKTFAGIQTTILVVPGATPQTLKYEQRSAEYHSARRVRIRGVKETKCT